MALEIVDGAHAWPVILIGQPSMAVTQAGPARHWSRWCLAIEWCTADLAPLRSRRDSLMAGSAVVDRGRYWADAVKSALSCIKARDPVQNP